MLKSDSMTEESIKPETKEKKSSSWDSVEGFASFLGKIAWIVLLIEGIIVIFWGIWGLSWVAVAASIEAEAAAYGVTTGINLAYYRVMYTMYIIGGIVAIIVAIFLVRPRFSDKWGVGDYDYLLNDVVKIGNIRIPLMLIIGIILEILLNGWGGLIILIPLLLLIFMGPKKYKWKEA